jgi:hypothetical protein
MGFFLKFDGEVGKNFMYVTSKKLMLDVEIRCCFPDMLFCIAFGRLLI